VKRDLTFEVSYPYPVERVWRALTDPQAIAAWLMPNDFEPRVGHKFQFRAKPQPGWDGIVHCEVLECDPPRRLVYTWKSNILDTQVAFTLEPVAEGTRLRLEHTGFRGVKALLVSLVVGGGWKGIMEKHLLGVIERMDGQGNLTPRPGDSAARGCEN
jgi:uncharacterized protein YndB with AHSA1/START domain